MISGHKTRSVFDRYNVVSKSDLHEAAKKLALRDQETAQANQRDYSYSWLHFGLSFSSFPTSCLHDGQTIFPPPPAEHTFAHFPAAFHLTSVPKSQFLACVDQIIGSS